LKKVLVFILGGATGEFSCPNNNFSTVQLISTNSIPIASVRQLEKTAYLRSLQISVKGSNRGIFENIYTLPIVPREIRLGGE
jgi:hypothetical protein